MAVELGSTFMAGLGELRIEPTRKRVRATIDGATVVDSSDALLVWEPNRVVPGYAVPVAHIAGGAGPSTETSREVGRDCSRISVWDPRVPFHVRTTPGHGVAVGPAERSAAGFVADEPVVDTTRERILFETGLTPRSYVPRHDVVVALASSTVNSSCAYRGLATYYSAVIGGKPIDGLAWSYETPLTDGERLQGRICFFDERMDVTIDGVVRARPTTLWSSSQEYADRWTPEGGLVRAASAGCVGAGVVNSARWI